MNGRVSSRRLWAFAFVGLLAAILASVLAAQSAAVSIRSPLVARPSRGPLVAVPLEPHTTADGSHARAITLSTDRLGEILAHEELWLFPSSSPPGARLVRGELAVLGTPCRFAAGSGGTLVEDEPLVLRRLPECSMVPTRSASIELVVESEGRAALGLWAYRPRTAESEAGPIRIGPPESDGGESALSVRGFLVDHPPTAPRIALLSAMWRLSNSPRWLWLAVAAAFGLAFAGCSVFPTGTAGTARRPSARLILSSAVGAALLALALAGLYAVLTPPLCGPDEPYHLLGFADLVGDAQLADETVAWMGQTHLLRIRYHPDERFRTVDVDVPFVADDSQLKPTEVEMRSAVLAKLWRALGPVLRGRGAPRTLLAIRLCNALLFAATVGLATALAAGCAAAAFPQWLCFPFLFVPSLPFFAMHVSETAVLCSIYVLLATSLAVLFLDGPAAHWAGLPLGLATGLMLAGGRSPWPLAAIVAAALVTRVVLGSSVPSKALRAAALFWSGFAFGAGAFFLVLNDAFTHMVRVYARFVPAALRPLVEWRGAPLLGVGVLALAALLEVALGPQRPRAAAFLRAPVAVLARWGALALAAWVVLSLLGSLFLPYPQLPLEPRHPLTTNERLLDVLATMGTLFRLRDPNFLLSTSFWVGFGWLDAIPGPLFQALLVALTAVPTVGLLLALSRPPQVRRFLWLVALGLGGVASLVLYTLVTQELPMALQGRYLIGWYLVFLTVAGCWLTGMAPTQQRTAPFLRPAVLLVVAGSIHVYCLSFILRRYF